MIEQKNGEQVFEYKFPEFISDNKIQKIPMIMKSSNF